MGTSICATPGIARVLRNIELGGMRTFGGAVAIALVLLALSPGAQAATATVNLNDGNCSDRAGLLDPCNVTDPSNAAATYVVDGIEHAKGAASVTLGELRVRTESMDLDTRVPDAQTRATSGTCPEPPPPPALPTCIEDERMYLESPSGSLPSLDVLDRVELLGFSSLGNNGPFVVVSVETPNTSYLVEREFHGIFTGPAETGVEVWVNRNEESRPGASARIEQLVLTYTDTNPFEIGAGKIGMAFEVDYQHFNVPTDGTPFEIQNETTLLFFARFSDVSAGTSTNLIGGAGHYVELSNDPDEPEINLSLPGARLGMDLVETERTTTRFSGRVESTVPITLEVGDTLTIVNAFFRVYSSGDLDIDDDVPGAPPVPVSVSQGFNSAHLYGDFPPGLVSSTAEPINWLTEPPSEEETLEVVIDIKPGSTTNCININDHGVIPVAILGSQEFDATQVDAATLDLNGLAVRVRGNGRPSCSLEDANDDGFLDLACRFEDNEDDWVDGESEAVVSGSLFDGTVFQGTDSICIVPPN